MERQSDEKTLASVDLWTGSVNIDGGVSARESLLAIGLPRGCGFDCGHGTGQ